MASEIQARIQMAKTHVDDIDDNRSVMSDMIKDDVSETGSVRSVSTTSSRRFRILPNPKKMIKRAFGGGTLTTGDFGDNQSDKRSVNGGSVPSIFSRFKMKDLHKDQELNRVESGNYNHEDHHVPSHSGQSSIIINDLNEKVHTVDRNVDRIDSSGRYKGPANNEISEEEEPENISVTRKDSNESIMSTMSNWSNFGFHLFGTGDSNHDVTESHTYPSAAASDLDHDKAHDMRNSEEPEKDLYEEDNKSAFSNSSQKSKFTSNSFGKMKKKVVKFFLKNSNDNISADRTNSNNSILSVDTMSQLEKYHNRQEENIKTLMGLGFDREAATAALVASKNNVDAAANRLLADLEHPSNRASVKPTLSTVSEDSEYLRPRNGPPSW